MKSFYIETDQLTQYTRILRYIYNEDADGNVSFIKAIDPATGDEMSIEEMKSKMSVDAILNISTAHLGNYKKVYI